MKKSFYFFALIFHIYSFPVSFSKELNKKESIITSTVPISLTVRSISDLKVKEGQKIKIGQVLALRPLDPETPQGYISKNHDREIQKQKDKLAEIKQVVLKNKLDPIIIQHEEAKLKDLEFAAKEFRLGAVNPKAPQETTYKSPINGFIKRIIQTGSSDGKLNIELLIETNS